jgi:hypothetical protein
VSRRTQTRSRVERRAEREARQVRRHAEPRQTYKPGGGGLFGWVSPMSIVIVAGVAVIVALLVYVVTQANNVDTGPAAWQEAQLDDSVDIPGTYYPPHPGADGQLATGDDRQHFTPGSRIPICTQEQLDSNNVSDPLCYTSNPPTSGPHSSTPMPFAVLENPAPKENLVHNMEHGAVVVWYNTDDETVLDQLRDIVQDTIDARKLIVMSEYPDMEAGTIALTSWTRLDKFSVSEFSKDRVQKFIEVNERRFNPEGF